MYLPNPFAMDRMWHKINLIKCNIAVFNSACLFLNWALYPYQGKRAQSSLLFAYRYLGEQMDSCLSQRHLCKVKHKQSHPRFEIRLLIPLLMTITEYVFLFYPLWIFHTCSNWLFSTEVKVTTSVLTSLGLF